jgi:hypothetical protein
VQGGQNKQKRWRWEKERFCRAMNSRLREAVGGSPLKVQVARFSGGQGPALAISKGKRSPQTILS